MERVPLSLSLSFFHDSGIRRKGEENVIEKSKRREREGTLFEVERERERGRL